MSLQLLLIFQVKISIILLNFNIKAPFFLVVEKSFREAPVFSILVHFTVNLIRSDGKKT